MTYDDWKRFAAFDRISREMNGNFSFDQPSSAILTGDASQFERLGPRESSITDAQASS